MTIGAPCVKRYGGYNCRQRLIRNGGWLVVVMVQLVVLFPCVVMSMDIKWTPNTSNNNNEDAATAPRSQKYWDEHNIERPDYAKTDWEIAQEKMKEDPNSVRLFIFMSIFGLTLLFFTVFSQSNQHAYRLGGNHRTTTTTTTRSNNPTQTKLKMPFQEHKLTSQEALRQARIEMFERSMKQQNKQHTD